MKRPFFNLFLIALVAFGVVFVSAPWFAFRALHAAAVSNDVQAMAELIDFNAVRQGMAAQIDPAAGAPAPDIWHDPIGAVKRALAPVVASHDSDAILTPNSIAALSTGSGPPKTTPGSLSDTIVDLIPGTHGRSILYWDPNRCRIVVKHEDGRQAMFTFERRGWVAWKLVQIRLPGAPAEAAAPAAAH
jgi:hypothetical protein